MAASSLDSNQGRTAAPWPDSQASTAPHPQLNHTTPRTPSTPVLNSSMGLINSWQDVPQGESMGGRSGSHAGQTTEGGSEPATPWPRSADSPAQYGEEATYTGRPSGPLTSLFTPAPETRLREPHVTDYNYTATGFTNSTLGIANGTHVIGGGEEDGGVQVNASMAGAWDNITPSAWWGNESWNYTMDNGTEFLNDSMDYRETIDVLDGFPYPSLYSWPHIIISSIVVTLIMLLIVLGNGLVVVAIAKDRNLKGLQNWYIASLAISDLFVGLFIMPLSLANELMGYWVFGNVLCELWLATDVLLCTASILNLCLISMDRYWSITRVTYVKLRTKRRVMIMITIVWVLSMIICFPPLAGWKRPQPTKHGFPLCVLSEEPGYVLYSTMGSFYIPLIIMILLYFKIYLAARSRARRTLKKEKPVANNGKSASNTSTTSFSNPSEKHSDKINKMSPTKESLTDEEEDDNLDSNMGSEGGHSVVDSTAESGKENPQAGIKLSVTNHHARFLTTDEKHRLLSDDTDSACDTPMRQKIPLPRARKIQFSEDTDSTSDCSYSKPVDRSCEYKEGVKGEENLKPLLEDSQLESDSQRESDKNSNKIQSCENNHKDHMDVPRVEVSGPGDDKKKRKKSNLNQKSHGSDKRKHLYLSPANLRSIGASVIKRHKDRKTVKDDPDKLKRKIARARERRATIVLGIVMASFIGCWLPFFGTYLVTALAGLEIPYMVFGVIFWLGYCNSALNPIIYTIFNRDFKHAFQRILFGKRQRR